MVNDTFARRDFCEQRELNIISVVKRENKTPVNESDVAVSRYFTCVPREISVQR